MAPGNSEGGPPAAAQQHRATGNGAEGGQAPRDAPSPKEAAVGQLPRTGCRISPNAPRSRAGGVHRPCPPPSSSPVSLPAAVGRRGQSSRRPNLELVWAGWGHQQWPRSHGPAAEHRRHPTPATAGAGWGLCPGEGSRLGYKQSSAGTFLSPRVTTASCPPHSRSPEDFAGRPGAPARCDANAAPDITPPRGRRGGVARGSRGAPLPSRGGEGGGASGVT